jgi:phospholipid/cholesterol/gamma-HCH transport system substrate-binding protein
MNQETRLGLFILLGAFCFVISVILLGDFQFRSTYKVNVIFDNVTGLPSKAKVKIAGVEVGGVKEVRLENGKAKVVAWIKSGVEIHADARARIMSTGLIGAKFLELSSGSSGAPVLKNGDTLHGEKPMSFDDIAEEAMGSLRKLVDGFTSKDGKNIGESLGEAVDNINKITGTLKRAIADQEQKINDIVNNVHSFTADIADITGKNKENINQSLADIRRAADNLDKILAKIERGEGTIGKLASDKQMGEDIQSAVNDIKETSRQARMALHRINMVHTDWDVTIRSDAQNDVSRGDFGLRIWPRDDKFYFLGANNIGDSADNATDPEAKNTISFLIGKKFKPASLMDWHWSPVTLYGGAMRSKAGAGIAVRPAWKWEPWRRLEITAEGYDFPRKTPVTKPKVNIGGRIEVTDWLRAGVQMEDTYSQANVNSYVNVTFRDDDIAYVLGLVGLAGR